MSPDVKLGLFELLFFELLANVKIILVGDQDITFNLFPYKEGADFSKINKVSLYSEFDPKEVLFIHTKMNEDDEKKTNILLYKDKSIVSFEDLDTELANMILQKMEEDKEESELPMRFKHFKSSGTILNAPGEDEDEDIVSNDEKAAELEDGVIEENPEAVVDTLKPKIVLSNNTVSAKLKQNNRNSI